MSRNRRIQRDRYQWLLEARLLVLPLMLLGAALSFGCGKRGPPLAPLLILPSPVNLELVRRIDKQVYIQFEVPTTNTDASTPADLDRIEIYALTTHPEESARSLPLEEWLELATEVATIQVRPPDQTPPESSAAEVSPASLHPDGTRAQGEIVVVMEELTPETLIPVSLGEGKKEEEDADLKEDTKNLSVVAPLSPPISLPPRRTYVLIGISQHGRQSQPSLEFVVPLTPSPDRPSYPVVSYSETEVRISWAAPDTARLPIQEPATGSVLSTNAILPVPQPSRYEVYDVTRSGGISGSGYVTMPQPVNPVPLSTLSYTDSHIAFGRERCYAVRLVDGIGTSEVRSPASRTACVALVDTFPPAAPTGLTAIGDEGIISLVWNENTEPDIAGYLVLRGSATGETLQVLIPDPIKEITYRDTDVQPGKRYVYAVQAVDTASPTNVSPQSEAGVEAAR